MTTLHLGPKSWRRTTAEVSSSCVILIWKSGLNLDRTLWNLCIPSREGSRDQNSTISVHRPGMTSRPILASVLSSNPSSRLLMSVLGSEANPNSCAFSCQSKYWLIIELISALAVVPSLAAFFSIESASDSESLIVLTVVLRSFLL
jgi:hypothetical protein